MKTFRSAANLTLAIVASSILTAPAFASGVQVYLDKSNSNQKYPDGTNYLKVSISDGRDGNIDFRVETIDPLKQQMGNKSGLQSFSFNFGDSGASGKNISLPEGWSLEGGSGESVNHSIFGKFDVQVKGTGRNRKDALEFSIIGLDGDTPEDYITELSTKGRIASLFATHVAGYNGPEGQHPFEGLDIKVNNGHFGGSSVVPIPAAAWLMFSGLAVLGWRGRHSVGKDRTDGTVAG
jgi:hypothetical protein